MILKVLILILFLFGTPLPTSWAQNPFSPGANQATEEKRNAPVSEPVTNPLSNLVNRWQRAFREQITGYARHIQQTPTSGATFRFLTLTFVFGILHAMGPGHGKSIVCSYFLARRGTLRQALVFSNVITFMHVLSATGLVFSLALLGKRTHIFAFQELEGGLQAFSAGLILLIGAFLLFRAIREILVRRNRPAEQRSATTDTGSMAALSFSAGLIPCPGAALILLFSLSLQIPWLGLLAMPVLAAGMGVTNSLVGLATMGSRRKVLEWTKGSPRVYQRLYSALAVGGAFFILVLGLSLLLASSG